MIIIFIVVIIITILLNINNNVTDPKTGKPPILSLSFDNSIYDLILSPYNKELIRSFPITNRLIIALNLGLRTRNFWLNVLTGIIKSNRKSVGLNPPKIQRVVIFGNLVLNKQITSLVCLFRSWLIFFCSVLQTFFGSIYIFSGILKDKECLSRPNKIVLTSQRGGYIIFIMGSLLNKVSLFMSNLIVRILSTKYFYFFEILIGIVLSIILLITAIYLLGILPIQGNYIAANLILGKGKKSKRRRMDKKEVNNSLINIKHLKIISKMVMLMFKVDSKTFSKTINVLNRIRKDNGILFLYKYIKTCRLHITRYICGKPLKSIKNSGVSITDHGPTRFLFLKDLMSSNDKKRYLLTLLTLTKGIKPNKKESELITPSFSSIEDGYSGKQYVIPKFFIDVMKRKYRISGDHLVVPSKKTLFLSMKSSPVGESIQRSLEATRLHPLRIHQHFMALMLESYDTIFMKALNFAYEHGIAPPAQTAPGKIAIVHDAEGKERVVAMSDYGSQWALKPIHDHCLNILKTIPMDRTFTQDPFNKGKDDKEKYGSLDLTSATDRFPRFVQHKILKQFYGDDIADAGDAVLVDREYSYKDTSYIYKVGQPMGCYSSWAVFALTHHFVVQWAAYLCGSKDFTDYILLGDDIVIKNNKVAIRYMQLMKSGGVEISLHKTHVSKHTYEFAKRGIHNGLDISPLPVKGIMNHIAEPKSMLILLLDGVIKTSFTTEYLSVYTIVKESYKRSKVKTQGFTEEYLTKLLYDFWIGLSYTKKIIDPITLRDYGIQRGYSEEFVPEGDEVFPFTARVTCFVLGRLINSNVRSLETYSERLLKGFLKEFLKDVPYSEVNVHPIFYALSNTLDSIYKQLGKFDTKTQDATVLADLIIVPGVNEIVHLKRQIRKEVIGIDKLWKEAIDPKYLSQMEDLFFMEVDTLGRANSAQAIYKAGNRLEVICSGKYVEKVNKKN